MAQSDGLTVAETTNEDRAKWTDGSTLEVYITNRNKWYTATITDIFTDREGEWLSISIQNKILFELRRSDKLLRRTKTAEELEAERLEHDRLERERAEKEESQRTQQQQRRLDMLSKLSAEHSQKHSEKDQNQIDQSDHLVIVHHDHMDSKHDDDDAESDGDLSTDYYTASSDEESSVSSSSSSMPSMDSLNSTDSEFDGVDAKYNDEQNEDPALIVIIVDRAGTDRVNGKYLYRGQQRGKGLWQKEGDSKSKLYWKYDNIWTLEYDTNDLYIAFTPRHLPPSSGWQNVDDAEYPSPSVVLNRLNQMVTIKNYFSSKKKGDGDHDEEEENDMTTSPLEFMDFDFEIPKDFEV